MRPAWDLHCAKEKAEYTGVKMLITYFEQQELS